MYRSGHVGIGFLLFSPIAVVLARAGLDGALAAGLGGMVLASTVSDVDEYVPGLAHRGPTHSVLAAVVLGASFATTAVAVGVTTAPAGTVLGLPTPLAAGLGFTVGTVGVIGHVAADVCTPMGVEPWWPVTRRQYSLELVPSRHPLVNGALLGVGSLALGGAFVLADLFPPVLPGA